VQKVKNKLLPTLIFLYIALHFQLSIQQPQYAGSTGIARKISNVLLNQEEIKHIC
jgi:hypothetical protein